MQIGPYKVERELGRGGMGVVLRARAPGGAIVAVKVLLGAGKETALARFDWERRLLVELGEAGGFVPILDTGQSPRGSYIVMPFVGGGTLRQRLERGPLPTDDAVALVRTLAEALGRAHARGIVHRDLKPENVLFTTDGRPLVSDLGLGKHVADAPGAKQTLALTKSGDLTGTVGYMAPEQATDARQAGPAADVFSLGVILYECIAGEPPFRASNALGLIGKAAAGDFMPLHRVSPGTPRGLSAVVSRALAPDPRQRPADGAALARLLEARASSSASDLRRFLRVLGPLVVVAVAATVAAIFIMRSRAPSMPELSPSPAARPSPSPRARPTPTPSPGPSPLALDAIPDALRPLADVKSAHLVAIWGPLDGLLTAHVLAFTPTGKQAVVGYRDGSLRLWNVSDGTLAMAFTGRAPEVNKVAIAPDGRTLLTVHYGGVAALWRLEQLDRPVPLRGHPHNAIAARFSPDGNYAITGGDESRVLVWDVHKAFAGEKPLVASVDAHAEWIRDLAVAPRGDSIVAACHDGTLRRFSFPDLAVGETLEGQGSNVAAVAFTPDGAHLVSLGQDGAALLWDLARGVPVFRGSEDPPADPRSVSVSPDGKLALATTVAGVRLIDLGKREVRERIDFASLGIQARDAVFLPDGSGFVVTTGPGACLRFALVPRARWER